MADKLRRAKVPHHIRFYHSIMDSEAYWHLSGNGLKVLLALIRIDNGTRNGAIAYSYRRAAEDTGLSPRTCLRCLQELQDKGFIVCTQKGAFSRKVLHASLWRYTWQAWPEGKMGPTRDFERWKPDGNTRVQVLSPPGAVSDHHMETDALPDADIAPGPDGKCDVSADPSLERIAPLTSDQGEPSTDPETEQRKHAGNTSGPFLDILRSRLRDHLNDSEPGEQSRIAKRVEIPGGTLSKFMRGKTLPSKYHDRLSMELAEF